MATVRRRRTIKTPSRKVSRKNANKHKRKVNVIGNKIIRENWDKKATLRQKYVFIFFFSRVNNKKKPNSTSFSNGPMANHCSTSFHLFFIVTLAWVSSHR